MNGELTAHLLAEDGVTPVRLQRTSPTSWENVDPITMRNGDVLDLGNQVSVRLGDLGSRTAPEEFTL